jgi:hypothetical protein
VTVERHDGKARCLSHALDPVRVRQREERNRRGGENRRKRLDGEPTPDFESKQKIRAFLARLAGATLRNEVDCRLVDTAVRCASTAANTHDDEALERLDKLEARLFGGTPQPLFAERRG